MQGGGGEEKTKLDRRRRLFPTIVWGEEMSTYARMRGLEIAKGPG